ncbi:tyrosine-protein phosphatase [Frankia sp. CNm7]|uniref:Tyrosine-protein phosphatase n=1 Tax=Frankia nepalensis TaxID=1836974 RepID=A0A937RIN8_9ACTN|nr:tyrosine-protein phosphatase [Frankia nepalensis]MBL7497130.1 tyrosine-protein phosphatase [Frankia nepalensis]MBL7509513.1 tyrosine-protein phosphatase [Frankia nepalensis]MBL7517452.1 tyrosine-protein phosphatase [Frankia nepalensis]MBL7627068.1 tyrosine-protein phosphatase [Frankia nepalensis]
MTTAHHIPRWIELAGAHNVRDLGGLPAAGGTVRPRVLLRGDSLDNLTPEDIELLREDVGLRGVVDLRAPFENPREAEWFPRLGITWLHEPLLDLTGLTDPAVMREKAAGYDYAKLYARMLESAGPGLARVLEFLVSGPRTPALVHCAAGKDRTGVTVAVLLAVAGVDRDAIVADYQATEQRIQLIREALARREEYRHLRERATSGQLPRAAPAVDPRAIAAVLEIVDAAPGGVAGFLVANGATHDQIGRWRDMIIEPG